MLSGWGITMSGVIPLFSEKNFLTPKRRKFMIPVTFVEGSENILLIVLIFLVLGIWMNIRRMLDILRREMKQRTMDILKREIR